jgi:hypothetical protein
MPPIEWSSIGGVALVSEHAITATVNAKYIGVSR